MSNTEPLTLEELSFLLSDAVENPMYIYQTTIAEELEVLRKVSNEVEPRDRNLELLIRKMHNTVTSEQHAGVGIAAPQIGINRRVFLAKRFDKNGEPFEFFINPSITWYSSVLQKGGEGCLSIQDEYKDVYRSLVIQITYTDFSGNIFQEIVEGFTAVIMQHELDHLNGILFTDHVTDQLNKNFLEANKVNELFYEE